MEISYRIDIDILEKLEKVCFPSTAYSFEQLREMLDDSERYQIMFVLDKEIVKGYLILFDNSESIEIMKIGTLPDYRRQGVGELLIREISKLKKDIFLEVRESNNAREFYKNCGFQEIGKRKNYYSDTKEAAIIMMKKFENIHN